MMKTQEEIRQYILDNILFGDGEKLDADVSFQESGILDSTGFLELITCVEQKYEMEIPDNELIPENLDTLRKMSEFVDRRRHAKTMA
jgi:acyl carrier protein